MSVARLEPVHDLTHKHYHTGSVPIALQGTVARCFRSRAGNAISALLLAFTVRAKASSINSLTIVLSTATTHRYRINSSSIAQAPALPVKVEAVTCGSLIERSCICPNCCWWRRFNPRKCWLIVGLGRRIFCFDRAGLLVRLRRSDRGTRWCH